MGGSDCGVALYGSYGVPGYGATRVEDAAVPAAGAAGAHGRLLAVVLVGAFYSPPASLLYV